jgi:hypothetical protein
MIAIVNLNNNIERELELENQGMSRTRRWIGDATQAGDERWYQARAFRIPSFTPQLDQASQMTKDQTIYQSQRSVLDLLSGLFKTRRQPIGSKS